MENIVVLNKQRAPQAVTLLYGTVLKQEQGNFFVITDHDPVLPARKSAGCLLEPNVGDRVLLCSDQGEECFILNILSTQTRDSTVTLPGQGTIQSEGQELHLKSDSVSVQAEKKISVAGPEVSLSGITGQVSFLNFSLLCSRAQARVQKAALIVKALNSNIGRLTQRVKNSFHWIENLNQTTAGRIRTLVKERFSVQARHISARSDREVTIDGEQIHLG